MYSITTLIFKQAFLQSLPTLNCPSTMTAPVPIQIMTCEGDSVQDSKILQGVLLVAPEIPTFRENKLLVSSKVKVAVYNISMAGDTEEWFDSGMKTEAFVPGQNIDMTSAVLKQMIEVADWLVLNGVQLVACQKCMHPALKQHLRDKVGNLGNRRIVFHSSQTTRAVGYISCDQRFLQRSPVALCSCEQFTTAISADCQLQLMMNMYR